MSAWFVPTSVAVLVTIGVLIYKAGRWTGRVSADLDFLKNAVDSILGRLGGPLPVSSRSPVHLTPYGHEIERNLGVKDWAKNLGIQLRKEVEGMPPYKIEEFARRYVESRLIEEWKEKIAEDAFRRGARREDIMAVFWVVLRDELITLTGQRLDK